MNGEESDAANLADVGADKVADELLHVAVDGATLFDGGHDAGKVVVGENHLGGALGDGGAGAHGDTDFGLLQGGGVVHTVASHSRDLSVRLQVLDDLRLVRRLHSSEQLRPTARLALLFRR